MEKIIENYFEKTETGEFIIRSREVPKPPLSEGEIIEKILNDETVKIPEHIELENKIIGDIIQKKVYDGNMNAELAELTKGLIKTLAVLVGIVGKEKIRMVYAEEISQIEKVSEIRVLCGLEPFDLSFLK